MNKHKVNKILRMVRDGKNVKFNDLRSAASEVGIKTKAGVKTNDLVVGLKNHISNINLGPGPGRPRAEKCPVVGYKVKIGLRYPTDDGSLTTNMREAATFDTVEAGQEVVNKLVETGQVREWGGTVRAKFLPRYGKSE